MDGDDPALGRGAADSASGITGADGIATATLTLPASQPTGLAELRIAFAGDACDLPASRPLGIQAKVHTTGSPLLDPSCWTSKPGNSTPPATVDDYIGVIVSTAIAQDGSTVYGNVAAAAGAGAGYTWSTPILHQSLPAGSESVRQDSGRWYRRVMNIFEARELKSYAEPVSADELHKGAIYFLVSFVDEEMLIPTMDTAGMPERRTGGR